jgi:ligand-binding sensor domain-containing protein
MKTQHFILNPLNRVVLFGLFMFSTTVVAELVFSPVAPIVEVGKPINLSVVGTCGAVTWTPSMGQIQGTGNQVTYIAPAQAGLDVVSVFDSKGNVGTVKIIVTPNQLVSLENANWEVLTNPQVQAIALSDDGTLWVVTSVGLEQHDAETGQLIRVFTTINGLPKSSYRALLSDDAGGVWLGSDDGLVHLSSRPVEWRVFNTENSDLPDNKVNALVSDGHGGLWIGSEKGKLAHLSARLEWTIYQEAPSGINALVSDGHHGVWIASYPRLAHLSFSGEWQNYDLGEMVTNRSLMEHVSNLARDGNGGVWIETYSVYHWYYPFNTSVYHKELIHLNSNAEATVVSTEESSENPPYTVFLNDGNGGLWAGTLDGLVHINLQNEKYSLTTTNSDLPSNRVNALVSDAHGGIWIGAGTGLAHLNSHSELTVFNDSPLPGSQIQALESDDSGGVWLGFGTDGLGHFSYQQEWRLYNTDNSELPSNNVTALVSDGGGLWVGTGYGGLTHLSSQSLWTSNTNDWRVGSITGLVSDDHGGLWVATSHSITYRTGTVYFRYLTHLISPFAETVLNQVHEDIGGPVYRTLVSDGDGGLWIEEAGGLAHLSYHEERTVFSEENPLGLPDNSIRARISDGQEGQWFGTSNGLAHKSSSEEWTIYNTDNSGLPDNSVNALVSEGSQKLWVGTDRGLVQFDGEKWTLFNTESSGLLDNVVNGLVSDNSGGLWVKTAQSGFFHLSFGQKRYFVQALQDDSFRTALLTEKRAAILIHPRGQGSGYKQDVSIEFMATHAYRSLQSRGYDNDEIYFLSYKPDVDINGDGFVDRNVVDGPITQFERVAGTSPRDLTRADIQQAFDWAKQKGQLDQPLLVIFVGQALTGQLRLDPFNEVLTAQDLGGMLTDYQQATGSELVVILEACQTGSLVRGLAGPNRLIVTSTAEDLAYYDNLGAFSFSQFYFDQLRRGDNFFDAFQTVSDKLPSYGHPFDKQTPQLDDNGDGQANSSHDGRLARSLCLNGCFGAMSGEITLESETLAATVTTGQTISLVVRAGITEGRIKRVWALVMTPDAVNQRNEQGFVLAPTPVVNLSQNPDDASRWQGSFSGFKYKGNYVVTFMAEDYEGFITAAPPVVLTLPEGPEVPTIATDNSVAPILAKTVYHDGDMFRVSLPPLPAGHVQYVGVGLPDGTIFVLGELNGFVPFDGATLPVWQGGEVAIEVLVSTGIPRGDYVVYLLRVPVGLEPMANQEQWMLGISGFRVE